MWVFTAIGIFVSAWWLIGVVMLSYSEVFVTRGAPLRAKVQLVFISGWLLPWIFLQTGRIPRGVLAPADPDPEDAKAIKAFMAQHCQCDNCRRKRGEI